MQLYAVDLGSGVGGFTRGLQLAGIAVVGAIDAAAGAVETYKHTTSSPIICGSLSDIGPERFCEVFDITPGKIDIVVGSISPPQMKKRYFMGDLKTTLESLRSYIAWMRPKVFVFEYRNSRIERDVRPIFETWSFALSSAGFTVRDVLANTHNYNVPQTRERIYLYGWDQTKLLPFRFPSPPFSRHQSTVTVREGLLQHHDRRSTYDDAMQMNHDLAPEVLEFLRQLPPGISRLGPANPHLYGRRFNAETRVLYTRLSSDQPAPSVPVVRPKPHVFVHPFEDRPLTLREYASLQTFDNSFICYGPPSSWLNMVASATPPLVAQAIGRALVWHLNEPRNYYIERFRRDITPRHEGMTAWDLIGGIPFRCFPRPRPVYMSLLAANGTSLRTYVDQSASDPGIWRMPSISIWDVLYPLLMLGLVSIDRDELIQVSQLGRMLYRWLPQLRQTNIQLLAPYLAAAVVLAHPWPFGALEPQVIALPTHPCAIIYQALVELDGELWSGEIANTLFTVTDTAQVDEAIQSIRRARQQGVVRLLGQEFESKVRSWMGLASFGGILCSTEGEKLKNTRYRLRQGVAPAIAKALRIRSAREHWSSPASYADWLSAVAGVPQDRQ